MHTERELIEKGVESGQLSPIDKDNFPFEHILVPESVYRLWEDRASCERGIYVTSFPDSFLSGDFRMPLSPIFGIHSETGDVITGAEAFEVDDSMLEVKKVWTRKLSSRNFDLLPFIGESQLRYDMIGSAIQRCRDAGLKYLYCIMEKRILVDGAFVRNEVEIMVRGA